MTAGFQPHPAPAGSVTPPIEGGGSYQYDSPYGKPRGLRARLVKWADEMGTNHTWPWAGLGIIQDIRLVAYILEKREWLEKMRLSTDPEAQQFATELLDDADELETIEWAAADVKGLPKEPHALPGVETIEKLDAVAVDYLAVRNVLVETGALAPDDDQTPVADLLRVLLA